MLKVCASIISLFFGIIDYGVTVEVNEGLEEARRIAEARVIKVLEELRSSETAALQEESARIKEADRLEAHILEVENIEYRMREMIKSQEESCYGQLLKENKVPLFCSREVLVLEETRKLEGDHIKESLRIERDQKIAVARKLELAAAALRLEAEARRLELLASLKLEETVEKPKENNSCLKFSPPPNKVPDPLTAWLIKAYEVQSPLRFIRKGEISGGFGQEEWYTIGNISEDYQHITIFGFGSGKIITIDKNSIVMWLSKDDNFLGYRDVFRIGEG